MKKFTILIAIATLFFSSCEYQPSADFSVNYDLVVPGEQVVFTNYSYDAIHYEWDFGDGVYSNLRNPVHSYNAEGIYNVTLAAFNGSYVDYTYLTIEVYETSLEIEVVDYATGNLIPFVNIVVYPTETDYHNYGRETFRGVTDYDGRIVIKGMNSQVYYIDAFNDLYNNFTFAWEDINNIRTLPLEHAMHNVFIAYVDYDPVGFKSAGTSELKVRKIVKSEIKRTITDEQKTLR
jgi:hypothetical protein